MYYAEVANIRARKRKALLKYRDKSFGEEWVDFSRIVKLGS